MWIKVSINSQNLCIVIHIRIHAIIETEQR